MIRDSRHNHRISALYIENAPSQDTRRNVAFLQKGDFLDDGTVDSYDYLKNLSSPSGPESESLETYLKKSFPSAPENDSVGTRSLGASNTGVSNYQSASNSQLSGLNFPALEAHIFSSSRFDGGESTRPSTSTDDYAFSIENSSNSGSAINFGITSEAGPGPLSVSNRAEATPNDGANGGVLTLPLDSALQLSKKSHP